MLIRVDTELLPAEACTEFLTPNDDDGSTEPSPFFTGLLVSLALTAACAGFSLLLASAFS